MSVYEYFKTSLLFNKMKINGKLLLAIIYFVITFIAAASIQTNPQFVKAIDDFIKYIQ